MHRSRSPPWAKFTEKPTREAPPQRWSRQVASPLVMTPCQSWRQLSTHTQAETVMAAV
ncbi:MAG: hypothetical protein R3F59_16725 [Myxococcota bacterium]